MSDLAIETSSPIRRFSDSQIQADVMKALSTLPAGTNGAVIAVADGQKAQLAALARLGEHWSVVGVLSRDWSGKLEGQAAAVFSW